MEVPRRGGKGKNAVIIEAITAYLNSLKRKSLAEEARRQSEAVSRNENESDLYKMADMSGWK